MKRILIYMMCMLSIGAFAKEGSGASTHVIECGQWITISAMPYEGFQFTEWSDHNTDSVRHIQVNEDATYIAFFRAIVCDEDSASWPVIVLHDWLLHIRLDLNQINQMGYYFKPDDVTWFQVVGEVDPILPTGHQGDDMLVGKGYEIAVSQDAQGTFYAIVNLASYADATRCQDIKRSELIQYSTKNPVPENVALLPNYVLPGETVRLVGLDPKEDYTVHIYSELGQPAGIYSISGESSVTLQAPRTAGCYPVHVHSKTSKNALKLVVFK